MSTSVAHGRLRAGATAVKRALVGPANMACASSQPLLECPCEVSRGGLAPFHKWGNKGTKEFFDQAEVTQPGSGIPLDHLGSHWTTQAASAFCAHFSG